MIAEIGGGIFSKRIVEELNKKDIPAKIITPSIKNIHFKNELNNYPIIHYTGSPTVTLIGILSYYDLEYGKKIIVSWIGFDIRRVKDNLFWRLTSKFLLKFIDANITDDEFVSQELNELGISVRKQPLPVYSLFPFQKLEDWNHVLIYLPDFQLKDFKFYQGNLIKKLVRDFPNVKFLITRNSGKYFQDDKNVECISWIENMHEVYEKSLAVIRLPMHDATGATIIETLSIGRTMIASNTNFPFCEKITNYDELQTCLKHIIENPKSNFDGSEYVHNNYNNSNLAEKLLQLCYNIM